jgi:hypothetical protein
VELPSSSGSQVDIQAIPFVMHIEEIKTTHFPSSVLMQRPGNQHKLSLNRDFGYYTSIGQVGVVPINSGRGSIGQVGVVPINIKAVKP